MSCIQMRLAPRGNGRFIPRTLVFGGQLGGIHENSVHTWLCWH